MSVVSKPTDRPSEDVANASNINPDDAPGKQIVGSDGKAGRVAVEPPVQLMTTRI